MGYTHYWTVSENFSQEEWDEILACARKIIGASSIPIQYEDDDDSPPELSNEMICFNGVGADGLETFVLTRTVSHSFCKTARQPYDEIVVAILIMVADVVPDKFSWSSDGSEDEHDDGNDLYLSALLDSGD